MIVELGVETGLHTFGNFEDVESRCFRKSAAICLNKADVFERPIGSTESSKVVLNSRITEKSFMEDIRGHRSQEIQVVNFTVSRIQRREIAHREFWQNITTKTISVQR